MQKIFNRDGFNWWIGVVEDRLDPEKLGRCRVRIFGYHTDSKVLLPTSDLPWCIPIQPITSAGLSGIGSSPLGPLEGSWVIGFFLDGEDSQQPAMFGTLSSKVVGSSFPIGKEREPVNNPKDATVKDSQGNPVLDSQGNPVQSGTPTIEGWEIGQTSEKFESGGRGPGTINDYNGAADGDLGGASYGVYQFASYLPEMRKSGKARPSSKNSPVLQFINNSKFKDKFAGLTPATSSFDSMWKEVANTNAAEFRKDQHDYVQKKYYEVMIANLQRSGCDLTKYGPGVQDLVWSTAVQFGPTKTSIFLEPLKNKSELSEKDIIILVSEYKKSKVAEFFKSSSAAIQSGVASRFEQEKVSCLNLVKS